MHRIHFGKSFLLVAGTLAMVLATPSGLAAASGALHQAVRAGDLAAVRTLLAGGADANARDDAGNTALMLAGYGADAEVLGALLRSGADARATNKAGVTALMRAATFGDKARLLLDAGAEVNARSANGNTALLLAARQHGNVATVNALLDRGASVNATNVFGASALMAAAASGDMETVRLLLDRGADANFVPAFNEGGFLWGGGRTALGWATFRGDEAMVKMLLARGARPDVLAITGSALTQAGWAGKAGVGRLLLDAGAPVDQRDLFANYTPLHWAASSEHRDPALATLLLARGADANAEGGQPVDGFLGATLTPLQLALKRGETPIAETLRKGGGRSPGAPPAKALPRPARGSEAAGDDATLVAAIQSALPPLQRTAFESPVTFERHASRQACISCHQQSLPLAALGVARARRFAVEDAVVGKTVERTAAFGAGSQEFDLQTLFHPEPAIGNGYALWSLNLVGYSASDETDSAVHHLAVIQRADGSWPWNLPRPPIQSSDVGATALAVKGLKSYPIPGRRKEFEQRVERARQWLAKVRPEFNEERAYQLLGLAWAGERSAALEPRVEALIREQRGDGGWAQLSTLDSDAFATGQALYALLAGAGVPASHPAVRRGLDFLVRTQLEDGTWYARRRAFPFQPPMDSSFAHGADGWLSASASSWAVLAMASALDPEQVPALIAAAARERRGDQVPAARKSASGASAGGSKPASVAAIDFVRDIQPVLERSCVGCHSGERAKGGYRVTGRDAFLGGGARGEAVVVAGEAARSPLLSFVSDAVQDQEMPPLGRRDKFPALTKDEAARLASWIDQGAVWPRDVSVEPRKP